MQTNEERPNFAYVELQDKNSEQKIVIAGIRITIESPSNRQKQFKYVLNCLKKFESNRIIIAGDFNCLRRDTFVKEWNLNVLSDMSKNEMYNITTPEGQSIYAEKASRTEYEFVILGSVIVLRKLAKPVTGGEPSGLSLFCYIEVNTMTKKYLPALSSKYNI